jgi:hypothetical protein
MSIKNPLAVTAACTDIIKKREALRLVAYLCPSNICSIG